MASPVDAESEYARSSGQVTNNITQISANVSRIRNMVAALGTPKDTHEMRDKLHHGIDETKLLAQDTKRVIASLGRIEGGYQGVANAERKFEQRKISEDFSKVLKTFQEVVRDSVQREKEYVARAKTRAHRSISIDSEEERLGLLDADKSHELMQMENDIEFNQALIAEREAGIKEVESTVREVNEIFKDLAIIVSDQGQMIDDIESSVVQSHDRTSAATVELKKAAENERKARRTMCCLISILVVVVVLIILIITNKI